MSRERQEILTRPFLRFHLPSTTVDVVEFCAYSIGAFNFPLRHN